MTLQTKRPTDVSIDLETLGDRNDAAIVAIGAAAFNRHTGVIGPSYYSVIDLEDALRHGRVTASTLRFWLGATDPRAKAIFKKDGSQITLYEALRGLNDFFRTLPANVCAWGNGSSFDISILEHAYDSFTNSFIEEWKFWSIRDMRTALDISGFDKSKIKFDGVPHNARDDAIHQAKIISACFGAKPKVTDEDGGEW